jgi:GTPase SAR1 family protein
MSTLAFTSPAAQEAGGRFSPAVPKTPEELGVPRNILVDIMVKTTLLEGVTTLNRLADRMKISVPLAGSVFAHLRKEQYVEVKGMVGNDYEFMLSASGRKLATDRYQISQYVGPVPVSLKAYSDAVRQQAMRQKVSKSRLREVFHDLVMEDSMLDQLGPAIVSNSQIFLYGSTGNGKTCIAERLVRVFQDNVYVPYALEVQGHIVNIYDTVVHNPLPSEDDTDQRWLRCERPCIAVGGEMVKEMLELQYEETLGYYTAPLQMKANNGMFIIDDFGRQMINPRDLLNRWVVPLDRRIDFLSLRTGMTFPVPFETMVVFSTNLDPRQLADEAFLRRIQNKIKIDVISPETFDAIMKGVCQNADIEWTLAASEYARRKCVESARSAVLRACYPRDIVEILGNIADYENRAPLLDQENIDRAATLYFAR